MDFLKERKGNQVLVGFYLGIPIVVNSMEVT